MPPKELYKKKIRETQQVSLNNRKIMISTLDGGVTYIASGITCLPTRLRTMENNFSVMANNNLAFNNLHKNNITNYED